MNVSFSNIERTAFKINNSTEVNPQPMQDVQVQLVNRELMIYMRGEVVNGALPGALVGFTLPAVGIVLGTPMLHSSLDYEMKIDECSNALLEAFESDLKWCTAAATDPAQPILNVVDGSAQKVYSKGGMWQIDDKTPAWVSTGFKPGPFTPNQWNKASLKQTVDPASNQFSFASITDGTAFPIPPTLRPLPLLKTNWTSTGVQFQLCLNKTGFAVVWLRNVNVSFSDY